MPFYTNQRLLCRITLILLLSAFLIAGCKKETIAGKSFRFPLSSEPRQLDPQVCTDTASAAVVGAIFEALTALDEKGKAIPGAAKWQVSQDGLTYTFTLFDNVWNDNTPVTAHDFEFGIKRAVMPLTKSGLAYRLYNIKNAKQINEGAKDISELGVNALDNKTLKITLNKRDNKFLEKTANAPFMPCQKSFFDSTGGRYGLETEYIMSNGAFYLKSWDHGNYLLLSKHDNYRNAQNILPSTVRYIIGNVDKPVSMLSEGLLDAAPIPADQLEAAEDANLTLVKHQDTIRMVWLNNSIGALSNAKVRCALRDSIEWDALYSQLNEITDKPATGFVPPDSIIQDGKYRTRENSKIQKSSGRQGADTLARGLSEAGIDKMPALTLLCADDDYSTRLTRYIAQSWQKNLSLYFSIEQLSKSELAARVKVGNYEIALFEFTASSANAIDALEYFASNSAGNLARFSNKNYDVRLATTSEKGTRAALEQLESFLYSTCPSIPLSYELRYTGIPEGNSGIIVRPFGGGSYGAIYDFFKAGKI